MKTDSEPGAAPNAWFTTTHWSVVLATRADSAPQAARALECLCRAYWYPLYAYVRRSGRSPEDAQDLTQAFFAQMLASENPRAADPQKGRFRSFLLTALNHFLADEWRHAHRQKRGGGQPVLSLDEISAEDRYHLEPVNRLDAEKIYERSWALTLLDQVLARLREEFVVAGKAGQFEQLRGFLLGDKTAVTYADAAAGLGLTEGAARIAVHRMRRRYQELFRAEIANTVAAPDEIEDEINHVFAVLSG